MKIEKNTLFSFIEKFRTVNHSSINAAIFKFHEEGLRVVGHDAPNNICSSAFLKSSSFVEYEAIGNIGLNEICRIVTSLKRFKGVITLKVEGNLLTISEANKKLSIELVSEKFLEDTKYEEYKSYKELFEMEASELNDILADANLKTGMSLIITTLKDKIIFTNSGKYKFERVVEREGCVGGTFVKMGLPFSDAISNLTGMLNISIASDYPIQVVEKSDDEEHIIVVAPMVGGDE